MQPAANGNSHPTFSLPSASPSSALPLPSPTRRIPPPPSASACSPSSPRAASSAHPPALRRPLTFCAPCGGHVPILQLFDKLPRVVALIRPQRHPLPPPGISLAISTAASRSARPWALVTRTFPIRPCRFCPSTCPQIAPLRLCRLALPPQPRLCVCRRLLRVLIPSLLPPKVHLPIPPALRRLVVVPLLLLRPEALPGSPTPPPSSRRPKNACSTSNPAALPAARSRCKELPRHVRAWRPCKSLMPGLLVSIPRPTNRSAAAGLSRSSSSQHPLAADHCVRKAASATQAPRSNRSRAIDGQPTSHPADHRRSRPASAARLLHHRPADRPAAGRSSAGTTSSRESHPQEHLTLAADGLLLSGRPCTKNRPTSNISRSVSCSGSLSATLPEIAWILRPCIPDCRYPSWLITACIPCPSRSLPAAAQEDGCSLYVGSYSRRQPDLQQDSEA